MSLDLSSLEAALSQLERVTQRAQDVPFMEAQDEITRVAIRAGVIQHFEIVYELSWKFVQRWLRMSRPGDEAESARTRRDLFRLAAEAGLVAYPRPWFGFGDARNLTAHTYNEADAEAVFAQAAPLAREGRFLLDQLRAHNA
jgi:nucleotidyltransferase substrate binding protein (TIGR01987 family)